MYNNCLTILHNYDLYKNDEKCERLHETDYKESHVKMMSEQSECEKSKPFSNHSKHRNTAESP